MEGSGRSPLERTRHLKQRGSLLFYPPRSLRGSCSPESSVSGGLVEGFQVLEYGRPGGLSARKPPLCSPALSSASRGSSRPWRCPGRSQSSPSTARCPPPSVFRRKIHSRDGVQEMRAPQPKSHWDAACRPCASWRRSRCLLPTAAYWRKLSAIRAMVVGVAAPSTSRRRTMRETWATRGRGYDTARTSCRNLRRSWLIWANLIVPGCVVPRFSS